MQTHTIDLSVLSPTLQQEMLDFYEFLIAKQTRQTKIAPLENTQPIAQASSGFAMLKSKRPAVPADFDPACLLKP